MPKTKLRPTSSLALLVAACGFLPAPAAANEVRAAFTAECPTTRFPGPEGAVESPAILTAIVASLASSLVDTGVAALKKAVNPGNATVEGSFLEQGLFSYKTKSETDTTGVVRAAPRMGCLVVAVGTFSTAADGVKGWSLPFKSDRVEPTEEGASSSNFRVANALQLQGPAELALYMEAARVFSNDRTAVTWRPVRLHVGDYLNNSWLAGRTRGLAVEMHLYKPGKKEAFLAQTFEFPAIKKPFNQNGDELSSKRAGSWSTLPAAPSVPDGISPTPAGRDFDPFTLDIRVVETPKPYALAIAFADAVDKNKDAIKKEVTGAIDSKAKEAAELTAETATLESISAYLTAYKAVGTECATDKLKDDAGKLNCSIARDKATVAYRKAEASCRSNGVPTCQGLPKVPQA